MATYDLKRFARAHILKAIAPKNLVSFLLPYREYFQQRGFDLSLIREEMKSEDFNVLLRVLIDPDLDTPQRLIDALYHVNEMATQEGMEVLLAAYEEAGYSFEDSDPTPADLAVQAWMMDGRLFETTCANQYKLKPRAYRVYQSVNGGNGSMRSDGEALVAFEHDLNDWFERRKRGRHCKVFPFPSETDCCYIIRHGEPYARVSTINKGESSCVFFQPEKFDTLIYDFDSGRLRIGASSKPTRGLYRAAFGRHLFGDDDYFPESQLFTLQPLLTDGRESLYCNDIPGLQHITLKHVQVRLDGGYGLRVTYDSEDIFDDPRFLRLTPPDALVTEAVLSVKYVGEGRARSTEIRIPNIVECRRDGDGVVLDRWLRERGFIRDHGAKPEVLSDPALEVKLPEAASLDSLSYTLLAPNVLPSLWNSDAICLADLRNYFSGSFTAKILVDNYEEPVRIPKVDDPVIISAVQEAVKNGLLWLTDGPASLLDEEVPTGYPTESSVLQAPPDPIPPLDIIPDNLPNAWSNNASTALTVASALSSVKGKTLPWVTVRRAIDDALKMRLVERGEDSGPWPCEFPEASKVTLQIPSQAVATVEPPAPPIPPVAPGTLVAQAELRPDEIQNLAESMGDLLKATAGLNLKFSLRIELSGDGEIADETVTRVNVVLSEIAEGLGLS